MTEPTEAQSADKPVSFAQKALSFAAFCRSSAFDVEDREIVARAFEQLAAVLPTEQVAETPITPQIINEILASGFRPQSLDGSMPAATPASGAVEPSEEAVNQFLAAFNVSFDEAEKIRPRVERGLRFAYHIDRPAPYAEMAVEEAAKTMCETEFPQAVWNFGAVTEETKLQWRNRARIALRVLTQRKSK